MWPEIDNFRVLNLSLILHFTNLLLIWQKVTLLICYITLHPNFLSVFKATGTTRGADLGCLVLLALRERHAKTFTEL